MPFTVYDKKPNSIKFGTLYTAKIDVPYDDKKRTDFRVCLMLFCLEDLSAGQSMSI